MLRLIYRCTGMILSKGSDALTLQDHAAKPLGYPPVPLEPSWVHQPSGSGLPAVGGGMAGHKTASRTLGHNLTRTRGIIISPPSGHIAIASRRKSDLMSDLIVLSQARGDLR